MLAAAAAVASILGAAHLSSASPITLSAGNSSVAINYNSDPSNNDGMYNWTVDNTNQLNQQWFWYRVGSSGLRSELNTLVGPPSPPTTYDTNGDGKPDWVKITYADSTNSSVQVSLTYSLTGGQTGSGASDMAETIKVTNLGSTKQYYDLVLYTDFNLGGVAGGQSVSISPTGANMANTVTQSSAGVMSQTVVSPRAYEYEVGTGGSGAGSLLAALESNTGSLPGTPSTLSGVDAAWAFEWNQLLDPGTSYVICVDKQIHAVPEPTTSVALLGLGGVMLTRNRRRDEDPDPRTAVVAEA
jgi:hypothetical protein